MAKFCSNCGEKLEDNAAFCPECGQKLEVQAEQINQPIQQASFNQPVQQGNFNQPVQQPNQPVNYQNGYNPYGQSANNQQQGAYNPYGQQAGYNPPYMQPGIRPESVEESLKWTTYNGRLNRMRYFLRSLALGLGSGVVAFIGALFAILAMDLDKASAQLVAYVFCVPVFVLSWFNSVKRAHDLDKSGWMVLLTIVPIVNIIFGLYLLFAKGTEGPNQYGEDMLRY